MKEFKRYLKVWWQWAHASFATVLVANRFSAILFLLGKVIRFFFFLLILLIFVGKTKALAGYTLHQAIFFFLVFNLVDISTQLFFRGVYWFRGRLVSGQFDFAMTKPIRPLFDALCSHPDPLDLVTLIILITFMIIFVFQTNLAANLMSVFLFLLLLANGFILGFAFHILVAAFGIITLEIDNIIWIYRDLSSMARIPIDVYATPIRTFLTFIAPVAIMMSFPAKALMGLLSWQWVTLSFVISGIFLWGSLRFWRYALTQYSSASS